METIFHLYRRVHAQRKFRGGDNKKERAPKAKLWEEMIEACREEFCCWIGLCNMASKLDLREMYCKRLLTLDHETSFPCTITTRRSKVQGETY